MDEFWYDKAGEPVTGAQPFRYRKPLMPGEVIDVVLRVPTNPKMSSNQYKFEHANGTIKATRCRSSSRAPGYGPQAPGLSRESTASNGHLATPGGRCHVRPLLSSSTI